MFTVIFHEEADIELVAMPVAIRAKMTRLLQKLEANPRLLREPDTKPLGDGLFEIRTMGTDIGVSLEIGNFCTLSTLFKQTRYVMD